MSRGAEGQENSDSLLQVFQGQVLQKLREMLQLFKQLETQQNRQQLQECCNQLARVGEQFNLEGWQRLCETISGAIANAENKYHSLAPIVIKDLKQSQELVLAGNDAQIRTSEQLQALSIPIFTKSSDEALSLHGGVSLTLWEDDNTSISVDLTDQNSAINDLSNLFAIGASDRTPLQDENNSLLQDTTELELVNSLFDNPVETSTSESIFSDLFDPIEDTEESLNLSEVSAQGNLTDDADLIDLWNQEAESDLETVDIPEVAVSRLENFLETEATQNHLNDFTELEILLGEEVALDSEVTIISQALLNLDTPTLDTVLSDAAPLSDATDLGIAATTTDEPIIAAVTAKPAAGVNRRRQDFGPTMRVPVKQLNDVSNLVGELVVNRNSLEQDQERLRQFLDNLLHQVQQLGDVGARMQQLYERSLLETSLLPSRQPSGFALPSETTPTNTPRHATGIDFDALEMDRFTSFHTLSQEMLELIVRVRESSSDIEFITDETDQVARQFRQVTTQLQEGLTRSRMIPFSTITDRLPRAVRDIAIKYGKQAELQIVGQDTLIDKMILEQLYDPMTHLVNNAITHGIETPEERQRLKKPPVGKIIIRAFHQGNQTIVSVTDDGAGIDLERVKTKALSQGLIVPSGLDMSRMDVYALLFHPGFSTKDQADDYAGRGIGMDVVQTSLNEIRGTITTDSTQAVGTTFTIRLPLTLSICKALCCLSDKARIAFPMDGVEDTLDIPASDVVMSEEGQSFIRWRDSLLRFRP